MSIGKENGMDLDYIESFLQKLDDGSSKTRGERKRLLKVAMDGKNPCELCSHKKDCVSLNCVPFYLSFKYRWQRLQKALLEG